ncbi:MAG: acyltransferase [Xanthobacteraceae bacterium]|nr:acyltransferase [Xanthobacteraceae bacterium]
MVSVTASDLSTSPAFDRNRVAHIDGLRAIAVLAVVAFHSGVPGIPGGFVGVDIFFVISGYLIINHIVQELAGGKFSFAQFYARRALRLLPPLFLTIFAAAAVAPLLLASPYEWEWLAQSAVTASLFVSNFYFLGKQGYFDIDAFEKPLLHTWSLSVEEQFYLAVPLILFACFHFAARSKTNVYRVLAAAALLVFAVSLIGCIIQTTPGRRNYAFYMMHWRAWEFAAGGVIGFLQNGILTRIKPGIANAMGLAGLALVAASISLIDETNSFPGYLPLFPVLGTVLVIAAGFAAPGTLAARLISFRSFSFIGLVSYSWYLWHWPMISLARIAQYGDPSLARDLTMAALSFGLAVVTYYLVELPARRIRERTDLVQTGKRIVARGIAASIGLAVFCGATGGFAYWWLLRDPALSTSSEAMVAASVCPPAVCTEVKGSRGMLIGDSHADRIEDAFVHQTKKLGIAVKQSRNYFGDSALTTEENTAFAVLFYRWNFSTWKYAPLEPRLASLIQRGVKRILLIGPVPEFRYKGANCFLRAQRYGDDPDRCALPRADLEARRLPAVTELKRLAEKYPGVRFVDPFPLFCDDKTCRPHQNGVLLHKDTNHLTVPYGGDWLYYHFKEDFWWAFGGNATPATTTTK